MNVTSGLLPATAAFLAWGLFPLYWKQLDALPALDIMLHRLLWCFVFVWLYLLLRHGRGWLAPILRQPRLLLLLSGSSLLIGGNWYLYIWAVTSGHIVETSLGYYINPLVNVLMGVLLLGERLSRARWCAVLLASAGVAWMAWCFGRLPWIALGLALSFASYGLLRKIAEVDAIPGLAVESALLAPLAIVLLLLAEVGGQGSFFQATPLEQGLLVLGGVVTALPLIWFATGARRLPYSTVGLLQYLAPSLQLLCGVLVFAEPFGRDRLLGFVLIWLALGIYAAEGWRIYRRSRLQVPLQSAPEASAQSSR